MLIPVIFSLAAIVDFGADGVGGYPEIEVTGVKAPAVIRVAYATHPEGLLPTGDFCHETRATYLGEDVWLPILPANTDRFDLFEVKSNGIYRAGLAQGLVRYAKWTLESGEAEVKAIRFINDGIHSTEPIVGDFVCSDEKLNGLWKASIRTCQLAAIPGRDHPITLVGSRTNAVLGVSHPYLSDGAKRDRLVWSGDLWWAQRNMYAAFRIGSPFMKGSIRQLLENSTPEGYVQACPYPKSHGPLQDGDYGPFASDEFAAWFIPVLRDHILHTADFALARECQPLVKRLVGYLVRHTGGDGLFVQRKETCKHAAGLVFGGESLHRRSYMNILLWKTYEDAASLADWLGDNEFAADCRQRAVALAPVVRRNFWNEKGGHFIGAIEKPDFRFEPNALALATGFATAAEAARILPQLKFDWHGKFQALAARGAFAYGDGARAMELFAAHNWYKLLDPEWKGIRTIQECDNLCTKGWNDEAHPDACLAGILTNYILGIEPVEPGYRVFSVKPRVVAGVTGAKGRVSTPFGKIEVVWKLVNGKPEITVRNPPGTRWLEAPVKKTEGFWAGSEWISAPNAPVASAEDCRRRRAADGTSWFFGAFTNAAEITSAKWTVAGLGVFEAYVNGKRVGRDFLKPGFTHYQKTKYSFSYDVKDLLDVAAGAVNELSAQVSAGWWRDEIVAHAGRKSAFRAVLEVEYADGRRETIPTTAATWRAAVGGPVTHAAIFDGEEYDARISVPAERGAAERNDEFPGEILPTAGAEITLREDLVMRRGPFSLKAGVPLVVDFGQNCAAVPRFRFRSSRGTVLTVLPAEMLNDAPAGTRGSDGPKGSVYRENLRMPNDGMRLVYTFADSAVVEYQPRFTFFGYRYLSLAATGDVEIESVESVPVTSITAAMESGKITTGDPAINQLVSNIRWGQLSNYLSIPTDCPQRDERLGWTADTQVFVEAGAYLADTRRFFDKWLRDLRDTQSLFGGYPNIAPWGIYDADEPMRFGWADAGVIVPWTLYRQFGDRRMVAAHWDSMEKYLARVRETRYRIENLPECEEFQWSDWLSNESHETRSGRAFVPMADNPRHPSDEAIRLWHYLGACYWLRDAQMMADMAPAIGKDAAPYRESAAEARKYLRANFVSADDGLLVGDLREMQTPQLFALWLGLVEGAARETTCASLRANFAAHGQCLQTGFLGTSIIMDALCGNGMSDIAYGLLLQHNFPSWLYSVDQGATTIWERWNSYTIEKGFGPVDMNSFNHYAYGAVLGWIFRTVAGISPDIEHPGYEHVIMKPIPDRRLGYVEASYRSVRGEIRSAWRYEGAKWIWKISIPEGVTASVTLPGETTARRFTSGEHVFEKEQK